MPYQLAEGYNNAAGLTPLDEIVSGEPLESHATSLGTFATGFETVTLSGEVFDDGYYTWTWTFAALTPADIAAIETNILNGARSGPVTVETRNRYGTFDQYNAILTLPRLLPLQGLKFGGVVFEFTRGEELP